MYTPTGPHTHETVVKKSRFIATVVPVSTVEQALSSLKVFSRQDATHNCWAYRIEDAYRFSDDGEPGGTAGRPILNAIDGQEMNNVLVLVTRYFGGIKLGTGGLVRAYGSTAAQCLRTAPNEPIKDMLQVSVTIPFDAVGAFYVLLEKLGAQKLNEKYTAEGVTIKIHLEKNKKEELSSAIADATHGTGIVH